tara:strand:+ start:302 stop:679 length:378 start_codon:yes stop_codon:yes gene_type:complete
MKLIKIRPRLVDHSLIPKVSPTSIQAIPKPVMKPSPKIPTDNSFMINIIGLLILIIFGYIMYTRWTNKESIDTSKRHSIIGFNHYVEKSLEKSLETSVETSVDTSVQSADNKATHKNIDLSSKTI